MDLAAHLSEKKICICAGSGGVGKTTTSASIAAGMAARGLKVAVLTIDPARRLADSLGLEELGNAPRRVDPARFDEAGIEVAPGGELWAMMLDPKATFDEVVQTHAPDQETRDRVLGNRIYQQISGALAGSQEYMAMEKLHEIHDSGEFDLLVLDTPPSRNALDFLDAPQRLLQFIEGRSLQMFLRPSGIGMRIIGRGSSTALSILSRITGVDLISDISEFFGSFSTMVAGFRERADRVNKLIESDDSTFVVVCSPESLPLSEAIYFHKHLIDSGLPFGAAIVNRVNEANGLLKGDQAVGSLAEVLDDSDLRSRVTANAEAYLGLAERDRLGIERLAGEVGGDHLITVPMLDSNVHDINGLATIGAFVFESG